MDFSNIMLNKEQKAGVVGEKITLIKVYNVKNIDGSVVSYKDSELFFENRTFNVTEYTYKYNDILKIKNDDGEFLFEPGLIDSYVFNSYIDSIKGRLENKYFISLKVITEIEAVDGRKIIIDGLKEYKITKVTFAKLSSKYGIVLEINNDFEVVYPNGSFDQINEIGWYNIQSNDIYETQVTIIEKPIFEIFSISNKTFLTQIRNGEVKVGMTENQCRWSWGIPSSSMKNIAGYDEVLIYGSTGNSQNLYFKGGILKLIK